MMFLKNKIITPPKFFLRHKLGFEYESEKSKEDQLTIIEKSEPKDNKQEVLLIASKYEKDNKIRIGTYTRKTSNKISVALA